jgi:hypothetical protein
VCSGVPESSISMLLYPYPTLHADIQDDMNRLYADNPSNAVARAGPQGADTE